MSCAPRFCPALRLSGAALARTKSASRGSRKRCICRSKHCSIRRCAEALVVTPTFPAYQAVSHRRNPALSKCSSIEKDFAPDAAAILSQITEHAATVAIASPCNPTRKELAGSELRLNDGLLTLPQPPYLLSDEINALPKLYFSRDRPRRLRFIPHHRGIVAVKGCALTGLRLGWIDPQAAAQVMWKRISFSVVCRYLCAARCD